MYSIYSHIYGINLGKYAEEQGFDVEMFDGLEDGIHTAYSGAGDEKPLWVGKTYGDLDPTSMKPVEYPDQEILDAEWRQELVTAMNAITTYEVILKSNPYDWEDDLIRKETAALKVLRAHLLTTPPTKCIAYHTS